MNKPPCFSPSASKPDNCSYVILMIVGARSGGLKQGSVLRISKDVLDILGNFVVGVSKRRRPYPTSMIIKLDVLYNQSIHAGDCFCSPFPALLLSALSSFVFALSSVVSSAVFFLPSCFRGYTTFPSVTRSTSSMIRSIGAM
jgi:hypothetical protein